MMDSCTGCDVVWLDYGELRQVIDAPGEDRGSRDL
jgi:Zn-finger nucleic acid-binding protein